MSAPADPRAFKPRNIAVAGRELAVAWADGHESYVSFAELRRRCPCAMCSERAVRPAQADGLRMVGGPSLDDLRIVRLSPVGAYAVQVVWADGHDSGIYAFEALRRMCPCPECRGS